MQKQSLLTRWPFLREIRLFHCLVAAASSCFLAFGLYNVHAVAKITEGGVLGLILLLEHWFHLSPAFTGLVLNILCYLLGWKLLGKSFLFYSAVATGSFSLSYAFFEQFDPVFPAIAGMPLLASLVGAVFVGVGAGFSVWVGGASGGDDALAMSLAKLTGWKIQWLYLLTDLTVLLLSLTYIPMQKIAYSLLTVILSGQIVGWIQHIPLPRGSREPCPD